MSKEAIVAAAVAAVQAGELQILNDQFNSVYDQAALEQKASDGTLSQADLDKAVAAQKAADQAAIDAAVAQDAADVKAGQDAVAAGKAALVDLQSKFDALSAKEGVEAGTLASLQAAKDKLQAVLDALNAIIVPPPAPAPAPAP